MNDNDTKPNCFMKLKVVNGAPRLFLIAKRTLHPGDELCYDYGAGDYPWREKVFLKIYIEIY